MRDSRNNQTYLCGVPSQRLLPGVRCHMLLDVHSPRLRICEVLGGTLRTKQLVTSAVSPFNASSPASGATYFSMYMRMVAPEEPVPAGF